MENHFLLTEDMLWDYADGFLTPTEKTQVDAYLRSHPEWQARYEAILEEKSLLFQTPLDLPKAGFSDKLMAAWATEQLQSHAHKAAERKDWMLLLIPALFGVFVLAPVVLLVVSGMQGADTVDAPLLDTYTQNLPQQILDVVNTPGVNYVLYLGITFVLLRLLEQLGAQRIAALLQHR